MALTRSKTNAAVATNQSANVMKTIIATIVAVATTVVIVTNIDIPTVNEPQTQVQHSIATETVAPEQPAETKPAEAPATEPAPIEQQAVAEPEPQPAPSGNGSCEQYRSLFAQYTDWDVPTAMAIAHAESSGCDPTAHNNTDGHATCTGSHGLMQVACFWADFYNIPRDSLYDPATNVEIAHRVYQRSGSFYPWTTWTGGKYKQYLSLYQ